MGTHEEDLDFLRSSPDNHCYVLELLFLLRPWALAVQHNDGPDENITIIIVFEVKGALEVG